MKYITTSEIEITYNVSRPTIGKWIEDAIKKHNNLHLGRVDARLKIIESPHNREILDQLSTAAVKYKQKKEVEVTVPKKVFYELYTDDEIADIYNNLVYTKQIDLKNVYKGHGQTVWNKCYHSDNNFVRIKCSTLLNRLLPDLKYLVNKESKVNVVDLGPGNGEPIFPFLEHYQNHGQLIKYVITDISNEILENTTANIHKNFPDLEIVSYHRDLERTHYGDILLSNKNILRKDTNLIFLIGNTIDSFDDRQNIFNSLSRSCTKDDLVIMTFSTDSPMNRAKINYLNEGCYVELWDWIISMMGIDFDASNLEANYNYDLNRNELYYVLDKDYKINFRLTNQEIPIILRKGEKILLWKNYLISLMELTQNALKSNFELSEFKLDDTGTIGLAMFCKKK